VDVTQSDRGHEYEHLAPLFQELADPATPDARRDEVRQELVTGHLPLAEHIARRFRNKGQPQDDLTQVGMIGLINAVDRYDPARGSDFLAFAVPTITGEIRRYFRDSTWAMRVPRQLKELHTSVAAASTKLGQQLGRAPRPSELAAELGLSVEEVYEGLQVGYAYRGESLDAGTDDGPGPVVMSMGTDAPELAGVETREVLYPALAKLPDRERAIVTLRFFGNMTQSQIGERLGISQMHVSRLLAGALRTLREEVGDQQDLL
jgi:RNA polymerase sigma-B factor